MKDRLCIMDKSEIRPHPDDELIKSKWYMCKYCRTCDQSYTKMLRHVERNHEAKNHIKFRPSASKDNLVSSKLRESEPTTDPSKDINQSNICSSGLNGQQKRSQFTKNVPEERRAIQSRKANKRPKRFKCHYCKSTFPNRCSLTVHERTHTGERPYSCPRCEKSFSQQTNLNNHIRTHTGEKPFHCKFCGKCFAQVSNLIFHERIHTGDRPYKCETCGKQFTQIANWSTHLKKYNHKIQTEDSKR